MEFIVLLVIVLQLFSLSDTIYTPNEIDETERPYTTGIKIKSSHYKGVSNPFYHTNYSKVHVYNKNYTSSLLDNSYDQTSQIHPVYISNEQKQKIEMALNEQNTHVIEKDILNDKVVYKRKLPKSRSVEIYNRCPKNVTGQFVYDLACNQFLDCWNGRGGPRNCAPGTLFNPKTLECDFPEKVECLTGPTGSALTLQKSAKMQVLHEQARCPTDFSGLMPNYTDCSKFVQCNSGIQTPRDCPPGTLFDTNLNVCNHAQEATCFSGQHDPQKGYDVKEEYGGSADFDTYGGQYRRPEDRGRPQQQSFYDQQNYGSNQDSNCHPTDLRCQSGGYVISGNAIYSMTQPARSQIQPTVYIQYVLCNPSVEDCSSFQTGTYLMGPNGALCDPKSQQCGRDNYYAPNKNVQTSAPSGSIAGTYFVKYVICNTQEKDCSYYQRGIVEARYGIPGTLIGAYPVGESPSKTASCDARFQNCEQSSYNQVSGGQIKSGQPCNPSSQECSTNIQNQGGSFRPEYPSQITTAKTPTSYKPTISSQTAVCPSGYQGITKHPYDCKKYLNCANGITYVQDCAPGTLFNPILNVCDFPYNVDCKTGDDYATTLNPGYPEQETEPTVAFKWNYGFNNYPGKQVQGRQWDQNRHEQEALRGPYSNQGFNYTETQFNAHKPYHNNGLLYNRQYNIQTQFPCQGAYCNGQNSYQGSNQVLCQGTPCNRNDVNQQNLENQNGEIDNDRRYGPCQGSYCGDAIVQTPQQGPTNRQPYDKPSQSQTPCQGSYCNRNQQASILHQDNYNGQSTNQGQVPCYGSYCTGGQNYQNQGQTFKNIDRQENGQTENNRQTHGQVENNEEENFGYSTTISNSYLPPSTQSVNSHVMKIPVIKPNHKTQPIHKDDRATSGGYNNHKSVDYVDIFDPNESQQLGYVITTTQTSIRKPEKQVWPPSFSDVARTDPNADYVFEYEDGETVTLAPENLHEEKRRKSRCSDEDFMCNKRSCITKNFVCDGVKDCDDGKDEKYCLKYLDEFKPYKNSRLDVLEKLRWNNVSHATCALLCLDNKKFECKSFNYRNVDKTCFLTDENIPSSGALKEYYPCDYYERKGTSMDCTDMHKCPNGKCLKSNAVCDGFNDCGDRADEKGCRASDFGYSIKLKDGNGPHQGRVEVTVFGKTGYICDDQFTITNADVLCRELGYELGALEVKGNSFFAKNIRENNTLYMMDDIKCLGNETSLMNCDFPGWGIHNCADREIVGVVCKTPQETCSDDFWQCDTGKECVRYPFVCDGIFDCTDDSDEASHHCDSPVIIRLVNGTDKNEGRLEIRHHDIWGSICDDDFNENAAKIVCSSLGYVGAVTIKKNAFFGSSSGPIWLDQVSCMGNETNLQSCTHWDWGENNCDHSEDVGIICGNASLMVDAKRTSKGYGGSSSAPIKDIDSSSSSIEPMTCGLRKDNIFLQSDDVHFRVVHGSVAKAGDYPWQAALRIKGQEKTAHWCGAIVISAKWVLTAAHCLEGYPKGAYIVVAGEYNIDENEGTEQQAFIEEYYLHEHFREGHKMGNDIAMVLLKGNGFRLNQDIQPICLPDESADYERDLNCTISGFGTVETGRAAYSHKLRAAWIPIQKMDICKMAHIYGENIGDGMICAGDLTGGVDACDGDSGGPLACLEDGVFTLYGITSWGQRCGYANKPGVYVKVSYYKKWIEKIMKLHQSTN